MGNLISGYNILIPGASAVIEVSASGDNIIVAAQPGKQIVVLQYIFTCVGAVTVRWKDDGGANLSGPMSYAAQGGAAPPESTRGYFATAKGAGLVMNLGGSVAVGGHLVYALI